MKRDNRISKVIKTLLNDGIVYYIQSTRKRVCHLHKKSSLSWKETINVQSTKRKREREIPIHFNHKISLHPPPPTKKKKNSHLVDWKLLELKFQK